MANPYNITEVDVPGMLTAYGAARSNRLREMLLNRQIAIQDSQLRTQAGVRAVLSRYPGGSEPNAPLPISAESSSQAPAALLPSRGMADLAEVYGNPDVSWAGAQPSRSAASPASPAPAQVDEEARRMELFRSLMALDPEEAGNVAQAFGHMDETQRNAATRRNSVLGRAAMHLLSLPQEQRSAEFQRIAPELIELGGVSTHQLARFELTDANLNHVLTQARDIEKIFEQQNRDQRLQHDIRDDEADNEREAALAESLIGWRSGQLEQGERRIGQTDRRLDITESDPRRVSPNRSRQPSPSAVIGRIMEKQARGERLSASEETVLREYQAGRGRGRGRGAGRAPAGNAPIARGPDGRRYTVRDGRWVPIAG